MFYYIKGIIQEISEDYVVIESNNIGYQVFVSSQTLSKVKMYSEETIYIYTSIREDEWKFFGFLDKKERDMFLLLITVDSVGPKIALQILSGLHYDEVALNIARNDYKNLSRIKGIGKKTAEKIIVVLKDKVSDTVTDESINIPIIDETNNDVKDAIAALVSLGYDYQKAKIAVAKANEEATNLNDLVRIALKKMN